MSFASMACRPSISANGYVTPPPSPTRLVDPASNVEHSSRWSSLPHGIRRARGLLPYFHFGRLGFSPSVGATSRASEDVFTARYPLRSEAAVFSRRKGTQRGIAARQIMPSSSTSQSKCNASTYFIFTVREKVHRPTLTPGKTAKRALIRAAQSGHCPWFVYIRESKSLKLVDGTKRGGVVCATRNREQMSGIGMGSDGMGQGCDPIRLYRGA